MNEMMFLQTDSPPGKKGKQKKFTP